MALVKAGWWQTTWWPNQWWHEDWWLECGTVATGGDSRLYYYPFVEPTRKDKKELLLKIKSLLQAFKGE